MTKISTYATDIVATQLFYLHRLFAELQLRKLRQIRRAADAGTPCVCLHMCVWMYVRGVACVCAGTTHTHTHTHTYARTHTHTHERTRARPHGATGTSSLTSAAPSEIKIRDLSEGLETLVNSMPAAHHWLGPALLHGFRSALGRMQEGGNGFISWPGTTHA